MLRALPPPLPRYLGSYLTSLSDSTFLCVSEIYSIIVAGLSIKGMIGSQIDHLV